MNHILTIRPPLSELYKLIDKVAKYPVSNRQLIDLAAKSKSPRDVVDFYKTFSDRIYSDRDELQGVSEQVDIMRQQEAETPPEIEPGPEEF
jgi:capsular polysaccharide biosynthesis protein